MPRASRTGRASVLIIVATGLLAACVGGGSVTPPDTGDAASAVIASTASPSQTVPPPTPVPTSPPSTPTPADSVTIECGTGAPTLGATQVRAQADGVHLLVTGGVGRTLGWHDDLGGGSAEIESDPQLVSAPLPPGDLRLVCGVPGAAYDRAASLTVLDPFGLYRSPEITHVSECTGGDVDYVPGATGVNGAPIDIVRSFVRGLRATDVVELAGYDRPESESLVLRIRRDGETIGSVALWTDGAGGWLIGLATLCRGLAGF